MKILLKLSPTMFAVGSVALLASVFLIAKHDHPHYSGVDVPFGEFTAEEIAKAESLLPDSTLSSKTRNRRFDGPQNFLPTNDVLTIVVDLKEDSQADTTDIFGNRVGALDVTAYGFTANQFDLVAQSIIDSVRDDYVSELVGTPAKQNGMKLDINIIEGDIGTPPEGVSEYYFVQVGSGITGPHVNFLGVAGGSTVRNDLGQGPNLGIEIGDVVGSIFTDEIQRLCCLSPANALSSGNLELTTNAITGTVSHEIGHVLSLSHIDSSNSIQPTPGASPIMGTGAIDLFNQRRIENREFSLVGVNSQAGGAPVFQVQQLVDSIGLAPVELFSEVVDGTLTVVGTCDDDMIVVTPFDSGDVILNANGEIIMFSGVSRVEIYGDDGNDMITVNGEIQSSLFGEGGDDTIVGSNGPDLIYGGTGEDEISGRLGADTIYAAAPGREDTAGNFLQGGCGRDLIFGSNFNDTIYGGNSDDFILALDGDDDIFGGEGTDFIQGGFGNDTIRSGNSGDDVFGGPGDDLILGGRGNDVISGGRGEDEIRGGFGQDEINGGPDDDVLFGNSNNDTLFGGGGNDTLTGGAQNDFLNGGSGNDEATDSGELGEFSIE